VCLLTGTGKARVALGVLLEVALAKELIAVAGKSTLEIGVALWHGGLPVDVLPAQGALTVTLGAEAFGW
jgi:hypothetical protein